MALHKKRKHEMGRPAAMTKIGPKRVHSVRCRGGNVKFRAMRLDTGNFAWGSEVSTMKVPVLDVVYNASNNELVRTKTLVKGAIVLVDAKPFQKWYQNHYGVEIGIKKNKPKASKFAEEFVSLFAGPPFPSFFLAPLGAADRPWKEQGSNPTLPYYRPRSTQ